MANISKMTLPNSSQYNLTDTNLPHSSLSGENGGTALSLVTTGEKYNWNNRDKKVTQTAITTNANYELLFSGTADNTSRTETVNKCNKFLFNPSTGDFKCTGNLTFEKEKMLRAEQLWIGSLTNGTVLVTANYQRWNYVIVVQNAGSDTNRKSMVIPIAMLEKNLGHEIAFEFHTESQFISFYLTCEQSETGLFNDLDLTFKNRSSGGNMVIREVWGAN